MNNLSKKLKVEELYNKGISLTKIGKTIGCTRQWASKYLKSIGYEIINYQNITKFNENYFDNIDTEEKAYWLGFLYADGYISSINNSIELSLSLKDIDHLYKLKTSMESKLSIKHDYFRCRFIITNKHVKKELISLGCTPKKSLTLKFPSNNQVPDNLIRHFIRGYFDGDGGIFITPKKWCKAYIMGTYEFLESLLNLLNLPLSYIKKDKRHKNNTYNIQFRKNDSYNLLHYLYNDSIIYLNRKYKLYRKYNCRSK